LVKCYNGIIYVRLRIIIFTSVHLIYTNMYSQYADYRGDCDVTRA
jgi:hypothetical protein